MLTMSFFIKVFVTISHHALKYNNINIKDKFYLTVYYLIKIFAIIDLLNENNIITCDLFFYNYSSLYNSLIMLPSFIIGASSVIVYCLTFLLANIYIHIVIKQPINFGIVLLEYLNYLINKIYLLMDRIKPYIKMIIKN